MAQVASQNKNNSTSVTPAVASTTGANASQHTMPTIQNVSPNNAQVYTIPPQAQVIYTTPVYQHSQQQQAPSQNSDLQGQLASEFVGYLKDKAKENKTAAQTNTRQESGALGEIYKQIGAKQEQEISDIYKEKQKAKEERQKEFDRLKEENEKFRKEKDEVNKNQEIENKIEERYGSKMEEKDTEIADLQEELADMQGAKEMLEQQIDELGGISMKDILLEEEESRKKHLEQLKAMVKDNNDALSSQTTKLTDLEGQLNKKQESIGIIKKILIFFGASEPKEINELKEKIEKAREQMKDLQQNVSDSNKELRENEKEYLKFINRKITTINNLHENQRNEVEQRDKMMQEIKNSKENQKGIKQMLEDRNALNRERNTNYINRLRMDEQKKNDMYEKIKGNKMYDKKQKDIYSSRAKYGTKSMQRDSIGRN